MEQGLNRNYELQDFGATTDKTAAYGDLIDAKLLLSGEIGIWTGNEWRWNLLEGRNTSHRIANVRRFY